MQKNTTYDYFFFNDVLIAKPDYFILKVKWIWPKNA